MWSALTRTVASVKRTFGNRDHRSSRRRRRVSTLHFESLEERTLLNVAPLVVENPLSVGWGWGPNIVRVGEEVYFSADDGSHGYELWVTDGSPAGTKLVEDIEPGGWGSYPMYMTDVNGTVFFITQPQTPGVTGAAIWKSNGTPEGTVMLKSFDKPPEDNLWWGRDENFLTNVNGTLFFVGWDQEGGRELWKSNGTSEGTVRVKDINPGYRDVEMIDPNYILTIPLDSAPALLTNINGTLYFRADDGAHGHELWKSNGTENGTVMIADIAPGALSCWPDFMTEMNGSIYFFAGDESTSGLWKTTGEGATQVLALSPYDTTYIDGLTSMNGTLYFRADDGNGPGLWKSNGTAEGTELVIRLNLAPQNNSMMLKELTVFNGDLYFTVDDGTNGEQLWKSNGTDDGTGLLKEIRLQAFEGEPWAPGSPTVFKGELYFAADDGIHGWELWKTNGTGTGTTIVADIKAGDAGSDPKWMTAVNDTLFFVASDGFSTSNLWTLKWSPVRVDGANLVVTGTVGNDTIVISGTDESGEIEAVVNGESYGPFTVTGQVNVDAGSGEDDYEIHLGGWEGTVAVDDTGSGEDSLTVMGVQNDDNSITKTTGTVRWEAAGTTVTVNFSGIDHLTLVGGSLGNVIVDPDTGAADLKDTTIVAGPAGSVNTVQIADTAAEVVIKDGGGQNTIAITLGNLAAPVTIEGTTGDNHVTVNAPSESTNLTLTASQLTSVTETINLNLGSSVSSSLDINLAAGAATEGVPTVEIVSTSTAGVTINAQGASDSSYNFVVDMGSLAGPVAINSETGTSQVTINAPAGENELILAGTQLTTGDEVVNLNLGSTLTALAVDGSQGTNQLIVEGSPPVPLALENVAVLTHVQFAGRVFDDRDNDGAFKPAGDLGIAEVDVGLVDAAGATVATATTDADGLYAFDLNLSPGIYALIEEQPFGLLDGQGIPGAISVSEGTWQASGYDFPEIQPSDISGMVFEDFNNDGEIDFGERVIPNVDVILTGTDDCGQPVSRSARTDVDGIYMFAELRPGTYTITEVQPGGFVDGADTLGIVDGGTSGDSSVNDAFSQIVLFHPGSVGENYNFGERPPAGGAVSAGQVATIGFWQNKNGQTLIRSLTSGDHHVNDSLTSTQFGDWLAVTFHNMYGAGAGANNLGGMTNADVAAFYSNLFRRTKREALLLGLDGPAKMDAQVMAVAFATYVTNATLAGTSTTAFGFLVTEHGVGTSTFNVATAGRAFDAADYSDMAILDLLLATDRHSLQGRLYDENRDGDALDQFDVLLRTLANDVYSAINEAGHI